MPGSPAEWVLIRCHDWRPLRGDTGLAARGDADTQDDARGANPRGEVGAPSWSP